VSRFSHTPILCQEGEVFGIYVQIADQVCVAVRIKVAWKGVDGQGLDLLDPSPVPRFRLYGCSKKSLGT